MARDQIEVDGVIVGQRGHGKYSVRLENGAEVIGYITGRMKNITITLADRVKIGLSQYDPTNGRIVWRYNR
jgi:translation initiation factor IF-1